jgi:MFS transporter, Spinster family, sphingosine-1-phosphate transporter
MPTTYPKTTGLAPAILIPMPAEPSKLPFASVAGAATALVLLTALNFINFIDRYILPGVQELVKRDFNLSDERIGALTFWFFLTYMFAAPLTGWLGDHYPRKPLIVLAALFWSATNLFTATVHTYFSLAFRHAALGIGEASFSIYAPALLADFYPEDQRNRVLTIFYTAIPVGAAVGYALGGALGGRFGWRVPFFVSAFPGILIALLILFLVKEPQRGATDPKPRGQKRLGANAISPFSLVRNAPYLYATLGLAMVVFSMGGISFWIPSFLQRRAGYSPGSAGLIVGALTVLGGLGGTAIGGWIAQRWLRTNYRALYLVSAWSALLTVPPAVLCFFGPKSAIVPGLALALFFIFLGNGPLNAAIVNSVPAAIRATAIAVELFLIHALGDAPSPRIIGIVSDHTSLGTGLGVTLVSLLLATLLLFLGARNLEAPPSEPSNLDLPDPGAQTLPAQA